MSEMPLKSFYRYVLELEMVFRLDIVHMTKPVFAYKPICKNKGAVQLRGNQLRGNHAANQRLCFHNKDSTIPLLPKSEISRL